MFEKLKANMLFKSLLKRPDISKAYKMVDESDSWYDTISCVHRSLDEIKKNHREVLEIKSFDNYKLKAIYYPCENSAKTMIWVHGYTSHAERESAFPSLFYRSLGYNVLIPYLRAHDISQGKYISFGALESKDLLLWVNKINEINKQGSIIIHGLSMGGGVALFACNKEMENVKAIIADAPSTSIRDFFNNVSKEVFKEEGEKVAMHAINRFEKEFNVNIDDYNAINIVKDSKYPILLSAGSNEHMDEELNMLKDNNPLYSEVIILPGCNHGNGMYKQTKLYQDKIKEFIEKYVR